MIPLPPAGPLFVGIFLNHKWKWIFGSKPSDHIRPFHFWGTKLWCISTCNSKTKKSKIERPKSKNPTRNLPTYTNMAMSGICFDIHLNFPIRLLFNQLACLSRAATAHVRQTRSLCTPRKKKCRFCHLMVIRRILFKIQWTKHALFPH